MRATLGKALPCAGAAAAAAFAADGISSTIGLAVFAALSPDLAGTNEAAAGSWILGIAPNNELSYGPDDPATQQLMQQAEIQKARDEIAAGATEWDLGYDSVSMENIPGSIGNTVRDFCTLNSWVSNCYGLGNQTKATIGSWGGTATLQPDGTTKFVITNEISVGSATPIPYVRDSVYEWDDNIPKGAPFSTVLQRFEWFE